MAEFFRELIPIPYSQNKINPPDIFAKYSDAIDAIAHQGTTGDDDKLLDLSIKLFENEAGRRASIDDRASGMMAAISLAAALVTGVGFTTFNNTNGLPDFVVASIFATYAIALVYLTATGVLCFVIQGMIIRSTPDPTDLVTPGGQHPTGYARSVAVKILSYTVANYKVNNVVVGKLGMAQTCFRNALLSLVIGGILVASIIYNLAPDVSDGARLAQALARIGGCSDLPALTVNEKGQWTGFCLVQGKSQHVVVEANGTVNFQL